MISDDLRFKNHCILILLLRIKKQKKRGRRIATLR